MVLSSCFRGPEKGKWLDNQSGRAEATSGWVTISKRECVIGKQIQTSLLYRTFPHGRRGDYNGVPKTLNGRHVGVQRQSSGSWIIFLICKRSFFFVVFQKLERCILVFHTFELFCWRCADLGPHFTTHRIRSESRDQTVAWPCAGPWRPGRMQTADIRLYHLICSFELTNAQWFYLMSNRFLYNLLWTSIFDDAQ